MTEVSYREVTPATEELIGVIDKVTRWLEGNARQSEKRAADPRLRGQMIANADDALKYWKVARELQEKVVGVREELLDDAMGKK